MLREYLLGELEPGDREQIEMRLLLDRDFLLQAEMLADELIEDYVDGNLSERERTAFVTHFLAASTQRDRLNVAVALKRHALAATPASQSKSAARARKFSARLHSLFSMLRTQDKAAGFEA